MSLDGRATKSQACMLATLILFIILVLPAYADPIWVRRYNGPGDGVDRPNAIAIDAQGYIYVTGVSHDDYLTVKYDSAGNQVWVARYDGPGREGDVARDIAVDSAGNVYVTGSSSGGPATGQDYATIKYDAHGRELWVARYHCGAGAGHDIGCGIAVDPAGYVYVTGSSDSTTDRDFATVKYSPAGIQQWSARYTSPGNHADAGYHIALDRQGNVYVLGSTVVARTNDIALIKYSPSGQEQWVSTYNGPGNGDEASDGLAVDALGNAYVCGSATRASRDCITIKYSPTGDTLWTRFYDGTARGFDYLRDIVLDNQGNVYVAGRVWDATNYADFVTIKYSSTGAEQWVATYDGPRHREDEAEALGVDAAGNVYTTGWSQQTDSTSESYVTIKYDQTGSQQWAAVYMGRQWWNGDRAFALAVDGQGNVVVTGQSDNDYGTVKYEPGGRRLWEAWYWGPGRGGDQCQAMALDAERNVYVAGFSAGPGTDDDYAVVKYHWSGVQMWEARFDGPIHSRDIANDVAIDGRRNVYVAGKVGYERENSDFGTIKYDSLGRERWSAFTDLSDGDEARHVAVDALGNVYVAGSASYEFTREDFAVVCYDSSGAELWSAEYDYDLHEDHLSDMVLDGSGNVYVTGWSYHEDGSQFTTFKYGPTGEVLWEAAYSGPRGEGEWSDPFAMARDSSGFIYVAGSTGSSEDLDFALVKYSPDGETVWTRTCDGPFHDWDEAFAIALSASGRVCLAGYCEDSTGLADYFTVVYDTTGNLLWTARYNGVGNGDDRAHSVAVDANDNVWVTGESHNDSGNKDIVTVVYNSRGVEQLVERYAGSSGDDDFASAVGINAHGDVYVCGNARDTFTGCDFITIRYPSAVGVLETPKGQVRTSSPGPTIVRRVLLLPRDMTELPGSPARVSRPALLDISGRKVLDLVPGPNDVRHLSPGVYFVGDRSGFAQHKWTAVRKVVVTR